MIIVVIVVHGCAVEHGLPLALAGNLERSNSVQQTVERFRMGFTSRVGSLLRVCA